MGKKKKSKCVGRSDEIKVPVKCFKIEVRVQEPDQGVARGCWAKAHCRSVDLDLRELDKDGHVLEVRETSNRSTLAVWRHRGEGIPFQCQVVFETGFRANEKVRVLLHPCEEGKTD